MSANVEDSVHKSRGNVASCNMQFAAHCSAQPEHACFKDEQIAVLYLGYG
jgi:hypothetical protein